jgi:hypothetical protein
MVEVTKKRGRKPIKMNQNNQQVQIEQPNETVEVVETDQSIQVEADTRRLERRRKRIPIVEQRRIMEIPNEDKDYYYRLEVDRDNNIERLLTGGYEIVDRNGKELTIDGRIQDPSWRHSAASQSVGNDQVAYLMRIPREWHEEDKLRKRQLLDEKTAMLKHKSIVGINPNQVYGEISVEG